MKNNPFKDVLALAAEVACFFCLLTLASNCVFHMEGVNPRWLDTFTYSFYAFTLIAILCNTFNALLYFQILIWAFACKFIYSPNHPWQSIGLMCIGFASIALNIAMRNYKKKQ